MIGRGISVGKCKLPVGGRGALQTSVRFASSVFPARIVQQSMADLSAAAATFGGNSSTPLQFELDPFKLQEEIRSLKAALELSKMPMQSNSWLMKDSGAPSEDAANDKGSKNEKKEPTKPEEKPTEQPAEHPEEEPAEQPKSEVEDSEPLKPETVDPAVGTAPLASTTAASSGKPSGASSGSDGSNDSGNDNKSPPAAPKTFPPLLAIPMGDRPPIPGTIFAINVEDPEVIKAIDSMIERKHPHFLLFHSKNTDVDTDVIQGKDSVHNVGVHCVLSKITKPDDRNDGDHALIVAYAQSRCVLEDLTTPEQAVAKAKAAARAAKKRKQAAVAATASTSADGSETQSAPAISNETEQPEEPTTYLNNFKVSYATSKWLAHEPYDKHSDKVLQLVSDIKRTAMALTSNNEVARDQLIRADKLDPHDFADYVASLLMASADQIQSVLETLNVEERLEMVLELIQIEDDLKRVKNKTTENMRKASFENQNKAFFREFINQFKQVAGLNEKGETDKISKYLDKVKGLKLTAEAQEAFEYELDKLKGQHENSSESFVIEKYLDWLVSVPWGIYSKDHFNIKTAKSKLEQDHFGLEDVKQRILEFISMGRISGNVDGKILCLVGPPGTGKTSIAKSIAESLNRKYVRIAMGGVQDMHELKGHRRTYVGAVPGRIILGLKQAKTSNPLMLIDEIDKLETTQRNGGSGASLAFLEILDPEQNHSFVDNYLDVKVDLSKVLFVCTANYIGNISPPLRDRMEVIEVNGYTTNEKVEITKRHLIPQAAKKAGLEGGKVEIPDETILRLIEKYCRESGLRNAKKQITRIFSKAAYKIVEEVEQKEEAQAIVDAENMTKDIKTETESEEDVKADKLTHKEVEEISKKEVNKIQKEVNKQKESDKKVSETNDQDSRKISSEKLAKIQKKINQIPIDNEQSKKYTAEALEKMKTELTEEIIEEEVEEAKAKPLEIPEDIKIVVTPESLKDFIGPETYPRDRVYETLPAGVATGLAYSGSGNGDALYIESILTNSIASGTGHAGIRVTGSLKDVMKESASISYSFSKQFISRRFPKNKFFEAAEVHVHCPDGAIPKDGPSAGISFTTSLLSLALNKPIAANIAMTGELTVTGRVLAVGGLREKILGAKRYGCDTIIFPKDIENVLDDIPAEVKDGVKLIPVEWYHEVFDVVFPNVTQENGNAVWEDEFSALEKKKKKEKS